MTNAELIAKIKAEIERRITDNTFGAKLELIDILAWLDTLESENPVPNDLEEAAREFAKDAYPDKHNLVWMFKRGAKWQKEQMMKEAMEGLICATITGTNAISFLSPLPKELTAGDKVKLIICKED